jgi:uncharacterized cupredoxin-like copper-binding protein
MQTAAETPDLRYPILFMASAFFVAAAFGAGLITMAVVNHPVVAQPAPKSNAVIAPVAQGNLVNATVEDFSIHLDRISVPAGETTFHVRNLGPSFHEFVILKTAHAAAKLPMIMQEGYMRAAEDTKDDVNIDELGGIKVDGSKDLTTTLTPGHYVIVCNLPMHYKSGMRIGLTVH